MPAVLLEILIILLLVLANGVFALSEIAIVSSRKARLQQQARSGSKRAKTALELAESPSRFLSTVQIGITLIGILAGTFGGATLASQLDSWMEQIPSLAEFSEALSLAVVVLGITYLSLIIGELVPKRIGLNSPERIAAVVAHPMKHLSRLASPAVWVLEKSSELVLRMLRVKTSTEPPVTEEEVKVMMDQGTAAGIFLPVEREMVRRVFRLADRYVDELMTPRVQIDWLNLDEPPERLFEIIRRKPHGRFPAAHGELENLAGVLQSKKVLGLAFQGEPIKIEAWVEQPLFIPASMKALGLLEKFRTAATTTAFVVDEYGSIVGMVTPADILSAIVGDMAEDGNYHDLMAVQRADGSWLLDGMLPVEDVKELLELPHLAGEELEAFSTLGGFVVYHLGRVPSPADAFERDAIRYEVLDMDGRRVDKVLVSRTPT